MKDLASETVYLVKKTADQEPRQVKIINRNIGDGGNN